MSQFKWIWIVIALGGGLGFFLLNAKKPAPIVAAPQSRDYQRIVSLSPSITECLFALGLGDQVVGVTNYCDYPAEALTRTKIGGYYDLNYEMVVMLKPDLVIGLPSHERQFADLAQLGLCHHTMNLQRVETILSSMLALGEIGAVLERAEFIVQGIRARMQVVKAQSSHSLKPRVMICVDRKLDQDRIDSIYVAGKGGFYEEMVELAGGVNAYEGDLLYPKLSGEGIVSLHPDIVIDMVADIETQGLSEEQVRQAWTSVPGLKAFHDDQIHLFTDDFVVIPGPRFINTLEMIARVIQGKGTAL